MDGSVIEIGLRVGIIVLRMLWGQVMIRCRAKRRGQKGAMVEIMDWN